jgi:hypothetical protein
MVSKASIDNVLCESKAKYIDTLTRMRDALDIATLGMIDGAHHKTWVIDQMVRILLGCEEDEESEAYKHFVHNFEHRDEADQQRRTHEWDKGIAP